MPVRQRGLHASHGSADARAFYADQVVPNTSRHRPQDRNYLYRTLRAQLSTLIRPAPYSITRELATEKFRSVPSGSGREMVYPVKPWPSSQAGFRGLGSRTGASAFCVFQESAPIQAQSTFKPFHSGWRSPSLLAGRVSAYPFKVDWAWGMGSFFVHVHVHACVYYM